MNRDNTEKLIKAFPLLYSGHKRSIQESLIPFGFEHDDGWFDIIWRLSSKIEPLIEKYIEEAKVSGTERCRWCLCFRDAHVEKGCSQENHEHCRGFDLAHPEAFQVKEKYGTLRFYMSISTQEIEDLIEKAEEESETTCEYCGTQQNVQMTTVWSKNPYCWLKLLCEECYGKYEKRFEWGSTGPVS
jgi:hypothetical protein